MPSPQYSIVHHADYSVGPGSFPLSFVDTFSVLPGDLVVCALYVYGAYPTSPPGGDFSGWNGSSAGEGAVSVSITDTLDGFTLDSFLVSLTADSAQDIGASAYQEVAISAPMAWIYAGTGSDTVTANITQDVVTVPGWSPPTDYLSGYFSVTVFRFNLGGLSPDFGNFWVGQDAFTSAGLTYLPYYQHLPISVSDPVCDTCLLVCLVPPGPAGGAGVPDLTAQNGSISAPNAEGSGVIYDAQFAAANSDWDSGNPGTESIIRMNLPGQAFPPGDPRTDLGLGWLLVYPTPLETLCENPPAGTVGDYYTHTFGASGGVGPYPAFAVFGDGPGEYPPGLTDDGAGTLSGIPTDPGSYHVDVFATDSLGYTDEVGVVCEIDISGGGGGALALACNNPPAAVVGAPYDFQALVITGGTGPFVVVLSGGSLPAGLLLSSTGVIFGTARVSGVFPFSATVTDSLGATDSADCGISAVFQGCR